MQSPVEEVNNELFSRHAETGDQENEGHCAVENAIFGADDAAALGDVGEIVGQDAGDSDADEEPLVEDEEGDGFEGLCYAPGGCGVMVGYRHIFFR